MSIPDTETLHDRLISVRLTTETYERLRWIAYADSVPPATAARQAVEYVIAYRLGGDQIPPIAPPPAPAS